MQEQLCCDVEVVTKVINEFNEIVAKLSSAEVWKFYGLLWREVCLIWKSFSKILAKSIEQ